MADNIVIGAGRVYAAKLTGDVPGPERYLGDSPGVTMAGSEGERIQIFAADGADSSKTLVDLLLDVTRSMTLELHDISLDNLELFLMGAKKSGRNIAKVLDELYPACVAGDEFQAGVYKANNAGGFPQVGKPGAGGAAITGKVRDADGSAGAAIPDADISWRARQADVTSEKTTGAGAAAAADAAGLVVFGDTGRVWIRKAYANGFALTYTPVDGDGDYVESSTAPVSAAIRYVEYDPRHGKGRNIYVAKAAITPSGDWALKTRNTEQQFSLACASQGKIYIDGVAT